MHVTAPDSPPTSVVLLGKVRAHRYGKAGFRLLDSLWNAGFTDSSPDGISVPEPVGTVGKLQMWLQRKVPGTVWTELLEEPGGTDLAGRIAEAAHKVHCAGVPTTRTHFMTDELRILCERVPLVAQERPDWTERIDKVLEQCKRMGEATPEPRPQGIHRDLYPDQVIVDGDRLHLIDFDLYCLGDPALDIGNCIGHITEYSLRVLGNPAALRPLEESMEERFVELAENSTRTAIHCYTTLTLVRHIYLSTLFPERQAFTEGILDLCEERLGINTCAQVRVTKPHLTPLA